MEEPILGQSRSYKLLWGTLVSLFVILLVALIALGVSQRNQLSDQDNQINSQKSQLDSLSQELNDLTLVGSSAYRQWKTFYNLQVKKWPGRWIRVNATNNATYDSYNGLRSFEGSPDGRSTIQNNYYTYDNGSTRSNGPWYYHVSYCYSNGMYYFGPTGEEQETAIFTHPIGVTAWGFPNFFSGSAQFFEIFMGGAFGQNVTRFSLTPVYETNILSRISFIREDTRGWPSPDWSASEVVLRDRTLPGNGTQANLTRLSTSTCDLDRPTSSTWQGFIPGNAIFNFPDNVDLALPNAIVQGTGFSFEITWFKVNSMMYSRVDFDEMGSVSAVTVGIYS